MSHILYFDKSEILIWIIENRMKTGVSFLSFWKLKLKLLKFRYLKIETGILPCLNFWLFEIKIIEI